MPESTRVSADRGILIEARERGTLSVLGAFVRLSGPGWLQSAITLGGGSLTGALFLGVLGGTHMLWLQLVAIVMGVIMLSAISYVTLSTGKRPFQAINEYVNPVLGCGWLLGTSMANMIWCMPQFSLSYAALNENLTGGWFGESIPAKITVSIVLLVLAFILVMLNERRGWAARFFDLFLKGIVGMIVVCFFGVVIYLIRYQDLDWRQILEGFIPDLTQWNRPVGRTAELMAQAPEAFRSFWSERIISNQRDVMIGAAATAVGINMTFLLPYSMLARGWDKPFRGLATFDLSTGMAIPYVLVTSCVVIASAFSFHGKVDEKFLSNDPTVMQESSIYSGAKLVLQQRVQLETEQLAIESASDADRSNWVATLSEQERSLDAKLLDQRFHESLVQTALAKLEPEQNQRIAALSETEKRLAGTIVKRDAFQLAQSLAPLLGERYANLIFGMGVLGMGFSTIIILMLINGYAYRELVPERYGAVAHIVGCLVAGICGALWPYIWVGGTAFWLAIVTSTFGAMLLPIAYITFFFMMNNKQLLGNEKPTGVRMMVWNVLMGISVLGAIAAAASAMSQKIKDPIGGPTVVGIALFFAALAIIGFAARPAATPENPN